MLAVSCLGACPSSDPNALVQKLTSISVGPIQPIDEATAKGIADELVNTVRCNAEDAARKVILPAVIVAGVAAIGAGIAAFALVRRAPVGLADARRRRRGLEARYRVTVRYRKFPKPTSLCVEAANKAQAAELVRETKGVNVVRVVRGC